MTGSPDREPPRPALGSVLFHWLGALAILGALGGGLYAVYYAGCCSVGGWFAFNLHASLGMVVLGLAAVRLAVRIALPWPPPPPTMARWEHLLASATHAALYALMIVLPLTGWVALAASGCCGGGAGAAAYAAHVTLAWVALGLIVLHAAAALFHHLVRRDYVLARMVPGFRLRLGDHRSGVGPSERA